MPLLKLKPAKPAKGCSWEGVGERVSAGEEVVDVGEVLLLRGDCDDGSAARVDEFEKTVRSFWRERAGERRWEGMVVVFFLRGGLVEVEVVVFGGWWMDDGGLGGER